MGQVVDQAAAEAPGRAPPSGPNPPRMGGAGAAGAALGAEVGVPQEYPHSALRATESRDTAVETAGGVEPTELQPGAAAAGAAAARGAGAGLADGEEGDSDAAPPAPSAKGPRKRRRDSGKPRTASRAWTEEEEALFRESLRVHGRNWQRASAMIGTRDSKAVASHAQKHLIRLLLSGEELPEAVRLSGGGYTLSGRPLDPNSAAARAYGLRPESYHAVAATGFLVVGVHVTTLDMADEPAAPARRGAGGGGHEGGGAAAKGGGGRARRGGGGRGGRGPGGGGTRKKRGAASSEDDSDVDAGEHWFEYRDSLPAEVDEAWWGGGGGEGDLGGSGTGPAGASGRARPRRAAASGRARLGETSESLDLQPVREFVGRPGSGAPLAQPFSLRIHPAALALADAHAHSSRDEVIGLLGGSYDERARVLRVARAYPCRRAAGTSSATSVEIDPTHQVEAAERMAARGLAPVGWYHSHPVFEPRPSQKDNENQRNYQALCARDDGSEPWVGIIVSPYDRSAFSRALESWAASASVEPAAARAAIPCGGPPPPRDAPAGADDGRKVTPEATGEAVPLPAPAPPAGVGTGDLGEPATAPSPLPDSIFKSQVRAWVTRGGGRGRVEAFNLRHHLELWEGTERSGEARGPRAAASSSCNEEAGDGTASIPSASCDEETRDATAAASDALTSLGDALEATASLAAPDPARVDLSSLWIAAGELEVSRFGKLARSLRSWLPGGRAAEGAISALLERLRTTIEREWGVTLDPSLYLPPRPSAATAAAAAEAGGGASPDPTARETPTGAAPSAPVSTPASAAVSEPGGPREAGPAASSPASPSTSPSAVPSAEPSGDPPQDSPPRADPTVPPPALDPQPQPLTAG